ncbi:probable prolyl 4-hydroxylase 9 isoform X1 [Herrania umbratica]|uniref:procollagen-proline 4-dioxygenase n=1 Tax=Herrania umbratica TaxID=108875 RepID=A0A6J0ZGK8_9ROSI|nr:probable prolyl 4-hydroxylase 9 isoform X1 [Herrania umbratica]XP_021274036.1 probable prolyl 4-hydroxylase 9 isoform X1 [Herrania umbratica]
MSSNQMFDDYIPKKKAKTRAYSLCWNSKAKIGFPGVFLFCCLFFLAGFLASNLLSQKEVSGARQRGRRLESLDYDLMAHGETGDDSISTIPFQVISWRPRAFYFPDFATPAQCQHIIDMAQPKLEPSTVLLAKGETQQPYDVRTSMGTFLSAYEDETGVLDDIEEKIAMATKLPRVNYEAFNVLRYGLGQKYDSHYDVFDPERYGPQKSQRVATFLLYLSDVEGGETAFPFEDSLNMDENYDVKKCIGLKAKPRLGDGLLFYSLFPNNSIDPTSTHGSCPVIKGAKWVATKWIRDEQDF